MNCADAIKALNNGATLHIDHKTDRSWVCTPPPITIHSIRRTTADKIVDMVCLNGYYFKGHSIYSVKEG